MAAVTVERAPLVPGPSDASGMGSAAGRLRALTWSGRACRAPWASQAARCAIPALVLLFLANVVLTQRRSLGDALDALGGAQWEWLPALVVAGAGTYVMAAVAITAACPDRLAFRRTIAVQVASAFTNRLAPGGLGGMATNLRYLQRCGEDRSDALSTVGITWSAGIIVHCGVVLTVGLVFWFEGGRSYRPMLPSGGYWALAAAPAAAVAALGWLGWHFLKGRLTSTLLTIGSNISCLRHRRKDLVRLVAGSAGMTCCHAVALVLALQAFGGGLPIVSIALVYLAATGLAAAVPVPGGVGPLETALVAGLVGLGADNGTAIAAVLTYRLTTLWLPLLPGAVAFRLLRRSGVL